MADRADITPELCRQLLRYEPETGKLFWKPRPREMFEAQRHCSVWNARYAGKEALAANSGGYKIGSILDLKYRANRVVWAITHGKWPEPGYDVDHINGDPADNRITNLRSVPHKTNGRNIRRASSNTSGCAGVSWNKNAGKWSAYIGDGRNRVNLGLFSDLSEAIAKRKAAEREHGYHANHGRS